MCKKPWLQVFGIKKLLFESDRRVAQHGNPPLFLSQLIFKTKTKFAWERSTEVTYTYEIPEEIEYLSFNKLNKGLEEAYKLKKDPYKKLEPSLINILTKSLQSIKVSTNSIPELSKRSMEIKVSFTAKKKGETGVEFSLFDLFEIDTTIDAEKTAVHTIALDFDIMD